MTFYEKLVTQTQMNYSRYHHVYASGSSPYQMSERSPLPYEQQIVRLLSQLTEYFIKKMTSDY